MVFLTNRGTNLRMVRGSTQVLEIQVLGPDGEPYGLLEGEVLRFGVKNAECSSGYLVKKDCTELETGICRIILNPEDTIGMEPGRYSYDVGLQSGAHYYPVVTYSEFLLEPNVTWKE